MAECKYYKLVRQVSYDSGATWISLDEYQKGDLYETDSPDCGGGITQYKWVNVSGEYTCVGTTKYQKTKKQQSTDGGQTWTDVNPPEYSTGGVIEYNSQDCVGGNTKLSATYSNGQSYSMECDSSAVLSQSNTTPSGYDKTKMTSAIIGNCVTSIGYRAFYTCSALTSVTIPTSVTSIDWSAFSKCTSFTSISIPNSVSTLGESVFFDCRKLNSVTLGSGLRSIGSQAFAQCYRLTNIVIPNGVTTIGYRVFENCSGLTSVTLPSGLTSIEEGMFDSSSLTGLTIPSTVTSIGTWVFGYCKRINSITIPQNVTSIGDYVFYACDNLTSLRVNATTPPTLGEKAFYKNDTSIINSIRIYVPSQSVNAYKSASGWSEYASRIQAIS